MAVPLPPVGHALVFRGSIVRFPGGELKITSKSGLVVVDSLSGVIAACVDKGDCGYEEILAFVSRVPRRSVMQLSSTEVLMPGLVDAHAHAPQHAFAGTGLDLPLLDWLKNYTFPVESRFSDAKYAQHVYEGVVRRNLRNGSTTASYFGTIHVEGTLELVAACERLGQRAHVGKVCMDTNAPDYYIESSAEASAAATSEFVRAVESRQNGNLVTPSIIPRFAPSCTAKLLSMLGEISTSGRTRPLPVHTHLSENRAECDWVKSLFPEANTYVDVYKRAGLLHDRSYFAHCCYCNDLERSLVAAASAAVVHCPTSNFMVGRALCDVRQWLDDGVTVGLGTDVAGGWSTSILDAARHAVVTSRLVAERDSNPRKALSWRSVLYLATKGGADVLGLRVGEIAPGNYFDALIVDAALPSPNGPLDVFDDLPADVLLEKFFWNGDDRNILDVFVSGNRVSGARKSNKRQPAKSALFFAGLCTTVGLVAAVLLARRR